MPFPFSWYFSLLDLTPHIRVGIFNLFNLTCFRNLQPYLSTLRFQWPDLPFQPFNCHLAWVSAPSRRVEKTAKGHCLGFRKRGGFDDRWNLETHVVCRRNCKRVGSTNKYCPGELWWSLDLNRLTWSFKIDANDSVHIESWWLLMIVDYNL